MGWGSPPGKKQGGWRGLPSDPVTPPVPWQCGTQTPQALPTCPGLLSPFSRWGTEAQAGRGGGLTGPEAEGSRAGPGTEFRLGGARGALDGWGARGSAADALGVGSHSSACSESRPRPAARPRPGGGGRGGGPGWAGAAPPRLRPAPRRAQPGLGARGSRRATARRTDGQAAGRAERPAVSARRLPSRAGSPSPLPRRAPPGPPSPSSAWGPSDAPTVRRPRGCAPRAAGCPHPRPAAGSPPRPRSHWTDAGTEAGDGERGPSGSADRFPQPARSSAPHPQCCRPFPPLHPAGHRPPPSLAPLLLYAPLPLSRCPSAPSVGHHPHRQAHILSSPLPSHCHTHTHTSSRKKFLHRLPGRTRHPVPPFPHPPSCKVPCSGHPPISHTHAWASHTRLPHTSLLHTRASPTGVSQTGTPLSNTCVCVARVCLSDTHACLPHVCLSHMHLCLTCVTHVSLA